MGIARMIYLARAMLDVLDLPCALALSCVYVTKCSRCVSRNDKQKFGELAITVHRCVIAVVVQQRNDYATTHCDLGNYS